VLAGCAGPPDAERFIQDFALQPKVGVLYELEAEGSSVGWLYGSIHYGTPERPSMSPAAARALAQTRHLYFELLTAADRSRWMGSAGPLDLHSAAAVKRGSVSAERATQAARALKDAEHASSGVAAVAPTEASYYENLALMHNHCGAFVEYGTERLALALAAGRNVTLHALETDQSRQGALKRADEPACKAPARAKSPAPPPAIPSGASFCKQLLQDVQRDQREDRAYTVTRAQACVLDSRHRTMAASIAEAVKGERRPFVIIGRGHLARGQNLIELIEAHGIRVRRVE
jgi:uncharacterized protein YbaP (TraB family)